MLNNRDEFLMKLSNLMRDYNAEFNLEYNESGCECCSGEYLFEISVGKGVDRKRVNIHDSYICPQYLENEVEQ